MLVKDVRIRVLHGEGVGLKSSVEVDSSNAQERQGVQVIQRAVAVLNALKLSAGEMSLGEIAKAVGLPRSTVQRLVDALARESFVIAASASGGVRLGPALAALGAATRFPIVELARPTLEALAKATGETIDLALVNGDKVVFLDHIAGMHRLAAVSAIGAAFPLHCTANGKAILAQMNEAELQRLRKRMALESHTKATLTSWADLDKELARIRKLGYAFDREEYSQGISAVGRAMRTPNGELFAITIVAPTERFAAKEKKLAAALLAHCEALEKKLG